MLNIKLNFPVNQEHIENLAYFKALLIKKSLDYMNLSQNEKNEMMHEILEYLKKNE